MSTTRNACRVAACALLFSISAAAAVAFGVSYSLRETCAPASKLTLLLFLAGLLLFCALFICLLRHRGGMRMEAVDAQLSSCGKLADRLFEKPFLFAFAALILLWLPYYLASFPGLYVYDAIPQTTRALCLHQVDTWHPLIHTYWMSGLMTLGNAVFGSYESGFALYTTSQYLLYAALISLFVKKLYNFSGSKRISLLCLAVFALFPLFPIMAVSSTKDTIFSASISLFVIELLLISADKASKYDWALLLVSGIMLSCFRNNGFYALIVAAVPLLVVSRKNHKLVVLAMLAGCLLLAVVVPKAVSERSSSSTEVLGVPIQQVSRVATLHYSELSADEVSTLESSLPGWRNYYPSIVDSVKFSEGTSEALDNNKSAFLKLWLSLMFKYPGDYLDATFGLINCWVNPCARFSSDGINHPYLEFDSYFVAEQGKMVRHWPSGEDFMSYDTDHVIEITRASLLPAFEPLMRSICYEPFWTSNIVLNVISSPAIPIIGTWLAVSLSLARRQYSPLLPLIFMVAYLGTCLLGPVYLPRYALPFYQFAPVVYLLVIKGEGMERDF